MEDSGADLKKIHAIHIVILIAGTVGLGLFTEKNVATSFATGGVLGLLNFAALRWHIEKAFSQEHQAGMGLGFGYILRLLVTFALVAGLLTWAKLDALALMAGIATILLAIVIKTVIDAAKLSAADKKKRL